MEALTQTTRIATTQDDVRAAWGLVYDRYLQARLIAPNPRKVHYPMQAVGQHTIVAVACTCGGVLGSTMTTFAERPRSGLAIDSIYHAELDALRLHHWQLFEVGSYANRNTGRLATEAELLDLMRWSFFFVLGAGPDALMMAAVHPRHAKFYVRQFGFEPMGPERAYPAMNNARAVLLGLNVCGAWANLSARAPGILDFRRRPLPGDAFDGRYRFADWAA